VRLKQLSVGLYIKGAFAKHFRNEDIVKGKNRLVWDSRGKATHAKTDGEPRKKG